MFLPTLAALAVLARAAPTKNLSLRGNTPNSYAPFSTACPKYPLVRSAVGLNPLEEEYIQQRKCKADSALAAWLEKQGSFCTTGGLPIVALASSGGGQRALLEGAGVVWAFDGREKGGEGGVGGLFQGLTYEGGLSGGAWFLSSLAGNNWPTVSYLQETLWNEEFEDSLLVPEDIFSTEGISDYGNVVAQVQAKEDAGFPTAIVDPWGRLLSYALLEGPDGGVSRRLSDLTSFSNFTNHEVPFPIMTAISFNESLNGCSLPTTAIQYEFTPFEYGSWDSGVAAFADTKYMGTAMSQGSPADPEKCIAGYDNLAYVLGVSSDVWTSYCLVPEPSNSSLAGVMVDIFTSASSVEENKTLTDLAAFFPNPFHALDSAPAVAEQETLTLIDGGLSGQVTPLWPFIQPARQVDVLIAADNSADTEYNWPNGSSIHQTYLSSLEAGLTRMPFIPTAEVFVAEGLNKRATFFGCEEPEKMMVVYLPNQEFTFASNTSTGKLSYTREETSEMLGNGREIGRQGGKEGWGFCLGCAVMSRGEGGREALPEGCEGCWEEWCYYR